MGNICCATPRQVKARGLSPDEMGDYIDEIIAAVPSPTDAATSDPELFKAEKKEDFSFNGMRFLAKVVDVYDGDTVRVTFRYGRSLTQYRARMAGYDSPEMKPPKSDPNRDAEKQAAIAARDALIQKLGDMIVLIDCGPFDKYGRILITMYTGSAENSVNVNEWMLEQGHGVPYDGGTKTPFAD